MRTPLFQGTLFVRKTLLLWPVQAAWFLQKGENASLCFFAFLDTSLWTLLNSSLSISTALSNLCCIFPSTPRADSKILISNSFHFQFSRNCSTFFQHGVLSLFLSRTRTLSLSQTKIIREIFRLFYTQTNKKSILHPLNKINTKT